MAQALRSTSSEDRFESLDDTKIFFRTWRPAELPRAVVVIVHGFNAHSGQYEWVAEQFVKDGLAVYALDLRGRGKSDGERFYVRKFADYTNDVADFVHLVKTREPGLPVFMLSCTSGPLTGQSFVVTDPGRALISGKCADIGKLKGPILRGLAARAPYFHNGSAATLLDVVEFYNQRFNLGFTDQQKSDLVAFLKTL